jgi:hypothetical protein
MGVGETTVSQSYGRGLELNYQVSDALLELTGG